MPADDSKLDLAKYNLLAIPKKAIIQKRQALPLQQGQTCQVKQRPVGHSNEAKQERQLASYFDLAAWEAETAGKARERKQLFSGRKLKRVIERSDEIKKKHKNAWLAN